MKMKDLESVTGIGRETIRYYIREGLLPEPKRHARNVATYSDAHVAGLKTIKRLQEERFLPLDVIRRVLKGDMSALPASGVPFPELGRAIDEGLGAGASELVTLASLSKSPTDAADAADFVKLDLIRIVKQRGVAKLSRLDARIVELWREMRRAGYSRDNFPASQLLTQAEAAAQVAKIEVGRFYDTLSGRIGDSQAAAMAKAAIETLNALFAVLHIRAILDEIAKRTAPPARPDGRKAKPTRRKTKAR